MTPPSTPTCTPPGPTHSDASDARSSMMMMCLTAKFHDSNLSTGRLVREKAMASRQHGHGCVAKFPVPPSAVLIAGRSALVAAIMVAVVDRGGSRRNRRLGTQWIHPRYWGMMLGARKWRGNTSAGSARSRPMRCDVIILLQGAAVFAAAASVQVPPPAGSLAPFDAAAYASILACRCSLGLVPLGSPVAPELGATVNLHSQVKLRGHNRQHLARLPEQRQSQ